MLFAPAGAGSATVHWCKVAGQVMEKPTRFTPQFGPNGAVMNAPTMTPEMRKKIEEAKTVELPNRAQLGWAFWGLVGCAAAGWLFLTFLAPLLGWEAREGGVSVFDVFPVGVALADLAGVLLGARALFQRWEFGAQLRDRKLLKLPRLAKAAMVMVELAMLLGAAIIPFEHLLPHADSAHSLELIGSAVFVSAFLIRIGLLRLGKAKGWSLP